MQLPPDVTDQLVGYDIEKIIAVTIAQAGHCEHGVPLLAPCEKCERVDMFEGDYWDDARKQWVKQDDGAP